MNMNEYNNLTNTVNKATVRPNTEVTESVEYRLSQ